jgi:hypothetical protein
LETSASRRARSWAWVSRFIRFFMIQLWQGMATLSRRDKAVSGT